MSSMIREVISGLECCLNGERYVNGSCRKCPYEWLKIHCREILYQDALGLLKEKAVELKPSPCERCQEFSCDGCDYHVREVGDNG